MVGAPGIVEVSVADKGYLAAIGVRSTSEPDRGRRHVASKGQAAAGDASYANRRRIRGARDQKAAAARVELLERSERASLRDRQDAPRNLRGHPCILKRLLVQDSTARQSLMRNLTGVGTPRSLRAAQVEALASAS